MKHYLSIVHGFLRCDAIMNAGRAALLWPRLLHSCYGSLVDNCVATALLKIIMRGHRNQADGNCPLKDFCEVFAGVGHLTRELLRAGFSGTAYDCEFSAAHDLLQSAGVRLVLDALGCVKRRGLLWLGTPCSSFVVLCRAQSLRTAANSWHGDEHRPFVACGNALGELSSLLFFLAYCLSVWVVLEQPHSSCLPQMPSMSGVLRFSQAFKCTTYMGQFGGASMKQLQLWSTWPKIVGLERPRPDCGGGDQLVVRDGHSFTGNKQLLEQSQIYTPCFGRSLARLCESEWGIN